MCDPLTIGSAALTAFGTYQQYQSQKKAQKRTEAAIRANGEANDRLRQQSQERVLGSADNFTREKFDELQNQETQKLSQKYTDPISQGVLPGEYYGGKQSENTNRRINDKNTSANEYSKGIAEALANLKGFGQALGVNQRDTQRAGELVGLNQNKEAGNNAVLPIQIEAARQSAANPLADIMVGLGSAGLTAGLSAGATAGIPAGATATGGGGYITAAGVPVPGTKPPVPSGFKLA